MTEPAPLAPGPAGPDPGVLAWPDLPDWLATEPVLLPNGDPAVPVLFVDLDAPGSPPQATSLIQAIPPPATTILRSTTVDHRVLVSLARHAVRPEPIPLTGALTCTLVADDREPVPAARIAVPSLGRWRTAYLALAGLRPDLPTALTWGLVDARLPA